ncbi:hypothetical protein [Mesorhizobium sp.]|uniref:hypothetical protein n=1 Tax=Mesorhizobium sp. TaxID=1871066 RepID=UPI000FE74B9F|nr:hypothetical protein [Mesorhizobium sp.]RWP05088.1 MAG: hypothetical protein EOQ99_16590 [Mesorhizobium sp.]
MTDPLTHVRFCLQKGSPAISFDRETVEALVNEIDWLRNELNAQIQEGARQREKRKKRYAE